MTLTANASDNVGVAGVQFKLDGANLGAEDTARALRRVVEHHHGPPTAAHTLTAVARDAAGNTTTSTAVSVTVANGYPAPTVSLTAPAAGATVSGTVTLSATASDNVGVAGVQFRWTAPMLGAEDTTSPYSAVVGHHPAATAATP